MKSPVTVPSRLRIVIVSPGASADEAGRPCQAARAFRAQALRAGLPETDYEIVGQLPAGPGLPARMAQLQPALIIIDAGADAPGALEQVAGAMRESRRPIVLFTDDDSTAAMDAAMAAGVSAYIVAGLSAERVRPVLQVALARFRQEQKLLDELSETRQKLAERKVIERAKGVLMARQGLSEDAAFQKLRGMAMHKKLKLADVAQRILDADDLLA